MRITPVTHSQSKELASRDYPRSDEADRRCSDELCDDDTELREQRTNKEAEAQVGSCVEARSCLFKQASRFFIL